MPDTLADQVASLLDQSRSAHGRALEARRSKRADDALDELREARRLRLEARDLDPDKTLPIWRTERPDHATMLAFYATKLGPLNADV